MKFLTGIINILKELRGLHKYSRDVIHGSFQFSVVLYIFAAVVYVIAPYSADYIRSMDYYQAALETAPVIFAAGIICGLLSDLVLRKKEEPEEKPDDRDKK